jgi:bifunctional non-homologous end joining protein LigD
LSSASRERKFSTVTPTPDRLERYRAKRSAEGTPEPFGAARVPATGRLFVFHKHLARNLHWDLRLEWEGALESWAVPKGPSPDPADKRLAMHVEPHPLDYAEFEGVIPEGQYGAGPTIVWDKGMWIPKEDFREGFAKGKLLFELRGYKVRGVWTLVHTPKAGENHWLLIKERDEYVDTGGTEVYADGSIYSGLPVEALPGAAERARELAERVEAVGAPRRTLRAKDVEVMKATPHEGAFTDPSWVFELKYDGYRLVAGRESGQGPPVLMSRNGNDLTESFPEIARAVRGLPLDGLVLDGEVVVLDERGLPSFDRLQKRGRLQRRSDIARASLELPAAYYAFDLLALEGLDLRKLPLTVRKDFLREILPEAGPIRYSEHIPEQGEAMYEQVLAMGLEGIVAKKADSAYTGTRSRSWYKIAAPLTDDFVVVGWTDPKGGRTGFGALHLAWYVDGVLTYAGSVGSGFGDRQLVEILEALGPLALPAKRKPEMAGAVPKGRGHHWVRPELVAEVRYREITGAGMARHPVFLRLRDDKNPRECGPEGGGGDGRAGTGGDAPGDRAGISGNGVGDRSGTGGDAPGDRAGTRARTGRRRAGRKDALGDETDPLPEPPPVVGDERVVPFTNLKKVFWPERGYTKGDLIEYYRRISPWLLPYVADRPLVLTRFPDGIDGKSFYQKDAPDWAPDWLRTVMVWSESSTRVLDYFVADDVESLLYLANLGTIPLHIWHSRVADLEHPDWCLLDLDPKDAPFAHVVEVALFLHELCTDIGLPHYVKTSGSTGLHVMIPLGGQMTYEHSRTMGELLAKVAVVALPKIATVARALKSRESKVYVDFLQNRQGQLIAAPFCVRPTPGATVSAPLEWSEVGGDLRIADYTIANMPERMERLEAAGVGDPLAPVLTEKPDLLAALERLTERAG